MATIAFCCGAELTADPSTTSHWSSTGGTVTRDATHVRSGSYALKLTASGTAVYLRKLIAAGNRHLILRFALYMPTLPASNTRLWEWYAGAWRMFNLDSDGYAYLNNVASTSTLPLDQWVVVDIEIDSSANPHTFDWKINGTAQTQATAAVAAADITDTYLGDTDAPSATWWYDDVAYSLTDGDYPIPAGSVSGTSTETWTDDPVAPTWTTPADTVAMSTTPELKFDSPASADAQHFQLQLDTADTFDTGDLRTYDSSVSQTNWAYWDGDSWEAIPAGGMPANMAGNEVRYTVTSALAADTWYRRVRASV